jgi:DNA-binding MarR family transcriptional regulator
MSKQRVDDAAVRVALLSADFGAASDEIDAAAARVFGVNRTDLRILDLVNRSGRLSAGLLAAAAGLSPAATTTAVQRLVTAGHLVRAVDPADRRRVVLTLTDSAVALVRSCYGPLGTATLQLLRSMSPAELATVEAFLSAGVTLQREAAARIRAMPVAAAPPRRPPHA